MTTLDDKALREIWGRVLTEAAADDTFLATVTKYGRAVRDAALREARIAVFGCITVHDADNALRALISSSRPVGPAPTTPQDR